MTSLSFSHQVATRCYPTVPKRNHEDLLSVDAIQHSNVILHDGECISAWSTLACQLFNYSTADDDQLPYNVAKK